MFGMATMRSSTGKDTRFSTLHRGCHLTAQRGNALHDGKGNVAQPAEWQPVGLEKRGGPAGGELIEPQVAAAKFGVAGERFAPGDIKNRR